MRELKIFSGRANTDLSYKVCEYLGLPLGDISVGNFPDGEISCKINEDVRGRDIYLLQPTCPPVNENLMELLVMVDACRRASAKQITAVVPYFGYARQDRRPRASRVPITAKLAAKLIGSAGVDRVLTVDLHADQIQGFFECLVDNVYASPILMGDIWKQKYPDMIVVSPDVGGVVRARAIAKQLDDADLAIIDKRRPQANQAQVMNIIGEVEGKTCIIVDDMVDTAGTLSNAVYALKERGAHVVYAAASHALFSGDAVARLSEAPIEEMVVTNTIDVPEEKRFSNLRVLSVADLLAKAIDHVHSNESVSQLFETLPDD